MACYKVSFLTIFIISRLALVELKFLPIPDHLSWWVSCCSIFNFRSSVLYVIFVLFVSFLLAVVLINDSFGIFKPLTLVICNQNAPSPTTAPQFIYLYDLLCSRHQYS